jgi:hypothetical protein
VGKQKALSGKLRASELRLAVDQRVYPCPEWAPIMIAMIIVELAERRRM